MSLAEIRDIFIIISAAVGIGATLLFSIISFILFRRVKAILDSSKAIAGNVRTITSSITQDLVKPLASVASIVQGIVKALDFISGRGKEEDKGA